MQTPASITDGALLLLIELVLQLLLLLPGPVLLSSFAVSELDLGDDPAAGGYSSTLRPGPRGLQLPLRQPLDQDPSLLVAKTLCKPRNYSWHLDREDRGG